MAIFYDVEGDTPDTWDVELTGGSDWPSVWAHADDESSKDWINEAYGSDAYNATIKGNTRCVIVGYGGDSDTTRRFTSSSGVTFTTDFKLVEQQP